MSITQVHGSAVSINGTGVLLLGESGVGKSDLALRLIDQGASLVADDQVIVEQKGASVLVSAPDASKGMLEVRGVGIVRMPYVKYAPLKLVVQLTQTGKIERLPEPSFYIPRRVPMVVLSSLEPSAEAKIRTAVQALAKGTVISGFWEPPSSTKKSA